MEHMVSPLEQLVVEVGGELDRLASNGRQLSRRMIVELAVEKGYSLGYNDGYHDRQQGVSEQGDATQPETKEVLGTITI